MGNLDFLNFLCWSNVRWGLWMCDDLLYCVSKGTSHTLGVYNISTWTFEDRTRNIQNSTQTFDTRVPNDRQVANHFILSLYDCFPYKYPLPSFSLCISALGADVTMLRVSWRVSVWGRHFCSKEVTPSA